MIPVARAGALPTFEPPYQPPTKAEFYHLIRGQIDMEDNLVNQRVIWMVFSQSFLFSAFATLLNAPKEAKSTIFTLLQDWMVWFLPILAVLINLLVYIGIMASIWSMGRLRQQYDRYPEDHSVDRFPEIQGNSLLRAMGLLAPICIPIIFIGTWIVLLVQLLFNG